MKTGISCRAIPSIVSTTATVLAWALLPGALQAQFVYVANTGSVNVSGYTINSDTGALTPISGSPFPTDPRGSPESVAVDPTAKFAYVANSNGTVSGYTINSTTGVLTPISGSPFPAGSIPVSVAVDPSGKFVYVGNKESDNISEYTIDPDTGALTAIPGSPPRTDGAPLSVAVGKLA
jgi:6-phosphogluconolactonase